MKYSQILLLVGLGTVLAACSSPRQGTPDVNIEEVRSDLQIVSQSRVLFGHQSVGRNLLAGVAALAEEAGVPLRIAEIDGAPPDSGPGLFHSNIGRNGDAGSKCEAFDRLLLRADRPQYDVALMKLCYTDLGGSVSDSVDDVLSRYVELVDLLRQRRPDVELVHVTMPLRAAPGGWKTIVKRLIGREVEEDSDNAMRNAFNDALRQRFAGERLFDLAALESTHADGARSALSLDGRTIYTLASEYTDDGGHLTPPAQRSMAAAFLHTLAAALRERS